MSYHKDPECNSAIIRLLDALCSWERSTGRRSTLLLIPHNADERTVIAQDGKPIPSMKATCMHAILLDIALRDRGDQQ